MTKLLLGAFLALFVAFPNFAAAGTPVMASASYVPAGRRAATPYVHPRMHRRPRRRRSQGRKSSRAFASGIPVAEHALRGLAAGPARRLAGDGPPPDHPPA